MKMIMRSLGTIWLSIIVILLSSGWVNARWCTRLKSEKQVRTIIEVAQCNQSYEAACGWFSSAQCTYYEMVECAKERNHTLVRYKIVEECCPGYTLDPVNNITCVKNDGTGHQDGVDYYEPDDSLLWGLPHGAYAGIVCSFLFVCCIVVLVALHVHKKRRNGRMKESETLELDVSEKMISTPQA